MPRKLGAIGKRRREEIVSSAVAIIAEEGIQNLSLSAIEQRAKMSRGQLTYYFHTKEDILLAVFDHLIDLMRSRAPSDKSCGGEALPPQGWDRLRMFLGLFIVNPPELPEFHALQYTFLSQLSHRDDFRQRLADLYEHWRDHIAADVQADLTQTSVSARTVASFVQAILHGIAIQRVADPQAFNAPEMLTLVITLLGGLLGKNEPSVPKKVPRGGRPSRTIKAGEK